MRRFARLLIFLMPLYFANFAAAQASKSDGYLVLPPSEIRLIHETIAGQVGAFRRGDVQAAFAYASPNIQRTFGDWETFGRMVEAGYGPIYSTFRFRFVETIGTSEAPVQLVHFTGNDLSVVAALYAMVLVPGQGWRIDGVQIFPLEQQAS